MANSGARALRSGGSDVVGLLLPNIRNEFYAEIAQSLADDCARRQRQLILALSSDDRDREMELVHSLLGAQPSGLVVTLTANPRRETINYLRQVYCVQFLRFQRALKHPIVTVEDGGGAGAAVSHLLKLGHRRIGLVGLSAALSTGAARLEKYRQAFADADVSTDEDLIRLGPGTEAFGYEATRSLFGLSDPPTALYLSAAPMVPGGIRLLNEQRIAIPDDVSVVVAGTAPWYELWPNGLTSVSLPQTELAQIASALILAQPAGGLQGSPPVIKLDHRLVVRGSTRAPALRSPRVSRD